MTLASLGRPFVVVLADGSRVIKLPARPAEGPAVTLELRLDPRVVADRVCAANLVRELVMMMTDPLPPPEPARPDTPAA